MRLQYERSIKTRFKQRKRSSMIEEGGEDAQTIKGTPKGPKIKFKYLKQTLTG